VEPSTGQMETADSDTTSNGSSGLWQTGVPDGCQDSLDSGVPESKNLCEDYQPPVPESVRPGKEPKIKDSELSEKDLARRNRRRQINRECARHARERRNHERDQLKNQIKKLTQENDIWKNKFEAMLRKNRQLSLKLEAKNLKLSTNQNQQTTHVIKSIDQKATQTYQPGEYSNSNLSRNIINGSCKRRSAVLQLQPADCTQSQPLIANKRAKMLFINPVSNSISDKKKIIIVNRNQIASNDSTNDSTKDSMNVPSNDSSCNKNEIATLVATMIEPLQQKIQTLSNKIANLENASQIKIEP